MLLLIFEDSSEYPHEKMLNDLKEKTLQDVNQELLNLHNDMVEPKLVKIFKVMKWMENKLSEKVEFPKMEDLGCVIGGEAPGSSEGMAVEDSHARNSSASPRSSDSDFI